MCFRQFIKELFHAFSTQKASVALGYRLDQLLGFFRALQTPRVHP